MTMEEARAWIARLPWVQVKAIRYGADGRPDPNGELPDPHQYVIGSWREVDETDLGRFVALIRSQGYRATYTPPYRPEQVQRNHYLQVDEWVYWFIRPQMLNRELAAHRKHTPIN